MSKPDWVKISRTSGSGDNSFTISAEQHTGRVLRSGTVTIQGVGADTKTFTVEQDAKSLFASFDDGTSMTVAQAGGNITIKGKSNAKGLRFKLQGYNYSKTPSSRITDSCYFISVLDEKINTLNGVSANTITLPDNYTGYGKTTANGEEISGDPGAGNEYAFSLELNFPENSAISDQYITLQVLPDDDATKAAQIDITQTHDSSFLALYSDADHTKALTKIGLTNDGAAQTVYVDSNTTWTVS